MIPILLGISFIVRILIDLSPGDVARIVAGRDAEDWEVQEVREELQLEEVPLLVRSGRLFWNAVHGSL
jgi:ABC-type dipeptide/oligopeptide/nickel transport system permease component